MRSPGRPPYPETPRSPVVDTYHGTAVPDPYRWLEETDSPATAAWVAAQNALTRSWLDGPPRDTLRARLLRAFDYPRLSVPVRRGGRYFFTYNPGTLPQPRLYVRDAATGADRVLLDPTRLDPEGTVALTALEVDPTGTFVVCGLSEHGADRQELRVLDGERGAMLPDRVRWVKFASVAWRKDRSGFFYTRFPEPGSVPPGEEAYFCKVYFHRLGDDQDRDRLVFERSDDPDVVFSLAVTADDRFLVITQERGASDLSEVVLLDLEAGGPPIPLFTGFTAAYHFIDAVDGRFYFRTDARAPRGRIVVVDLSTLMGRPSSTARATGWPSPGRTSWSPPGAEAAELAVTPDAAAEADRALVTELVAESPEPLAQAAIASRTLVAVYLHDASHRARLFDLAGHPIGEIPLPPLGTVTMLRARPEDDELLLGWTTWTQPPTSYRFVLSSRVLEPFPCPEEPAASESLRLGQAWSGTIGDGSPLREVPDPHARSVHRVAAPADRYSPAGGALDPSAYVTEQVWITSADGTNVPMFLVARRDGPPGPKPTLLTGYGGFGITVTPLFDPAVLVWLDLGGLYGLVNVRGGGEYGDAWHRAGTREHKPRVFDDFIAAAEWLVRTGRTTPRQLAIEGASNGGLLVAACLVRRPDLFGAVVCRVPVVDMLRYHRFTVGRFWIPEYGCAEDPDLFPVLLGYSPYHQVRDGVAYPATLVLTADHDDRVDPAMARKFVARLQQATAGEAPILLRVDARAGHGAGKPLWKQVEEEADVLTFLVETVGRAA